MKSVIYAKIFLNEKKLYDEIMFAAAFIRNDRDNLSNVTFSVLKKAQVYI